MFGWLTIKTPEGPKSRPNFSQVPEILSIIRSTVVLVYKGRFAYFWKNWEPKYTDGIQETFFEFLDHFPSLVSHHDRIRFLDCFFDFPIFRNNLKFLKLSKITKLDILEKFRISNIPIFFLILKFDIFMIFKISKIIKNYWIISIIKIIIKFLKIYKISLISVFLRYSTFSNLFNNSELFQTWQFLIFLNLWLGLSIENLNSGPVFRMWPNFPLSFCRNSASTAALRMALGSFYSYLV